jgi:hypothetical protein
MDREPTALTDARFLLSRAGSDTPPTFVEIADLRDRLAAMRAHPSCRPGRAEQLDGAIFVLDVLALATAEAEQVAGELMRPLAS